jgi:hypothetical protein
MLRESAFYPILHTFLVLLSITKLSASMPDSQFTKLSGGAVTKGSFIFEVWGLKQIYHSHYKYVYGFSCINRGCGNVERNAKNGHLPVYMGVSPDSAPRLGYSRMFFAPGYPHSGCG